MRSKTIHPVDGTQRWLKRWTALGEMASTLGQELRLTRVAQIILERVGQILEADRVLAIWHLDPDREALVLLAHQFRREQRSRELRVVPLDAPLLEARAATTRSYQQAERAEDLAAIAPLSFQIAKEERLKTLLVLPLPWCGTTVGVLTVGWRSAHRSTPDEIYLAEVLSNILAREIHSARSYIKERRRAEELAALVDVTEVGLACLELDPLLEELLERVRKWTQADAATIYDLDTQVNELVVRKAVAVPEAELARFRTRVGERLAGEVAARSEPMIVRDIQSDPRYRSSWLVAEKMHSLLGVPLLARGHLIGVVELAFCTVREFSAEDVRLLQVMAERAAMAVEHVRLYSETQDARRRLELFLGVVVHDLRGPLTAIRGYAQLLQREMLPPEQRARALEVICDQVRMLDRLVGDLLDFSRIIVGRLAINPRPTDLVVIAKQVVDAHRLTTPQHRFILDAPSRLEGEWDRDRITQVLNNLVNNAVEYSRRGGEIRLRLRQTNREVEVRVTDQGIGITRDEIRQLFEPFVRLERTRSLRGAGLGLFICKGVIEAHGGRIWVESEGLNKGSSFTFVLPRFAGKRSHTRVVQHE